MDADKAATIWSSALKWLNGQMTQATYNTLFDQTWVHDIIASAVSGHMATWIIGCPTDLAQQMLSLRHTKQVEAVLDQITGDLVQAKFIKLPPPGAGLANNPAPSNGANHNQLPAPLPPRSPASRLAAIDYQALWFDGRGTGYDRMAKYWGEFWRAYLSRLNGQAYSLWEYLQVADKRNVKSAGFNWWTPVKKYRVRPLGRLLGCAPATISGGFRQCPVFGAALAAGQELEACCGAYCPTRMSVSRFGNPQCLHWSSGAFESLYNEGLLAIRRTGDTPRTTFYHLQIFRMLPLLTPAQVDQLHEVERIKHEAWLSANADKTGMTVQAWEAETKPRAALDLPIYAQGRDIHDPYQPNPLVAQTPGDFDNLLDSMESNRHTYDNLLDSMESNS